MYIYAVNFGTFRFLEHFGPKSCDFLTKSSNNRIFRENLSALLYNNLYKLIISIFYIFQQNNSSIYFT